MLGTTAAVTAVGADKSAWSVEQLSEYNKLVLTTDPLSYDTMKTATSPTPWPKTARPAFDSAPYAASAASVAVRWR
ncbi:hypothetical protein [Kitasatospora sp. GP82]|uniref:hypothetical protein n=1 Tax=Kitasatospora sp. GP82 TaxID=3035089 RepID=UPI002473C862|nr:hypothetical protein [Kitasatospora sp. GP82]MDH6125393.1 hypothetical protein [Kitasatospora sp. GP82]